MLLTTEPSLQHLEPDLGFLGNGMSWPLAELSQELSLEGAQSSVESTTPGKTASMSLK